jgi:hypothetical protein
LTKGLENAFPGYFLSSALYGTQFDNYAFYSGWLYGGSYKIPFKKYILEPKLLMGNMDMDTNPYTYQFKEKGATVI